jgi:hypothetical protein
MIPENESPTPSSADRGVFGNLPSERPGVRSPRRAGDEGTSSGGAGQTKPPAAKATSRGRSAGARQARPRPQPPKPSGPAAATERTEPGPAPPPPEPESSRAGIEEVAWAGVTVAAEAATLGVRLVSRALEAVRERR